MLAILNGILVHMDVAPLPVDLTQYRVEYDREELRMELYYGWQKVEYGVSWHGDGVKIDGRTGKLAHIPKQKTGVRAVFGGNHIDFVF